MLRQSVGSRERASAKAFLRHRSLKSYIADCRKIVDKPWLAYFELLDRVKAASFAHIPSTGLSAHAFADGFVHLIGPRFVYHLLIIGVAALVATMSGIGASTISRSSSDRPWEFQPFANRSIAQTKNFLDKPALPFTLTPARGREGIVAYQVVSGDNITSIAEKFGISAETVVWANKLDDSDAIQVGNKLDIMPVSGVLHTVTNGETVSSIAVKYGVDTDMIAESEYNNLTEPYNLFVGQKLVVAGGKMPEPPRPMPVARSTRPPDTTPPQVTAPAPSQPAPPPAASAPVRGTRFMWPTVGPITQGYSGYHPGIDIAPPYGTPIYAIDDGVVIGVETIYYGYGLNVLIDHGGGYSARYSHLSRFNVVNGQKVTRGQVIGFNGSTGYSTGPHLDFRIYVNGVAQNPLKYLP